jgi:3-phenylpropionate/cinnamic acid dioxygenase small subunit
MTINTKFSVRDTAWVLYENKAKKIRILRIDTCTTETLDPATRTYTVVKYFTDGREKPFDDTDVYKSKEALIQSL